MIKGMYFMGLNVLLLFIGRRRGTMPFSLTLAFKCFRNLKRLQSDCVNSKKGDHKMSRLHCWLSSLKKTQRVK
ncbi:Uncharacterised protein [Vibrio cholerae]|nr:Uncharacterised protein [Vibrio cholerae]